MSNSERDLPDGQRIDVNGNGEREPAPVAIVGGVRLERGDRRDTPDEPLWAVIRQSASAIGFKEFDRYMEENFCGPTVPGFPAAGLPFPDIDAYRYLKAAAEAFLMSRVGVLGEGKQAEKTFFENAFLRNRDRIGPNVGSATQLRAVWNDYLEEVNGGAGGRKPLAVLPYLAAVRSNFRGTPLRLDPKLAERVELCNFLLDERLRSPVMLELIWSWWHEEGQLTRTLRAISTRFQNRLDPYVYSNLAELEIGPLRPVNNLLWGYVQDEQHRLTLDRRAYEYEHHYGLRPSGVQQPFRPADRRSRFLQAFHALLHKTALFYKEDDDVTVIADAFPVLNAIRDAHLILSEGAHNQFGDLPWTARQEMLMEQWLLARPEFDEFLPGRRSIVYPERWMSRVDAMKKLQGRMWGETSVRHYRDLGVFGEQLLLSIRYGNWGDVTDANQAANWARFWREEVQWYIHAYQAVTGVDLSAGIVDVRVAEQASMRDAQLGRRTVGRSPTTPAAPTPQWQVQR